MILDVSSAAWKSEIIIQKSDIVHLNYSAKIQHPESAMSSNVLQCPPTSLNVPICPDKGEKDGEMLAYAVGISYLWECLLKSILTHTSYIIHHTS
jgi:hypothetical protein